MISAWLSRFNYRDTQRTMQIKLWAYVYNGIYISQGNTEILYWCGLFITFQFLRPDLVQRMKARGVIANIQPQFVPTDAELVERVIPSSLRDYSYPWKTLIDSGDYTNPTRRWTNAGSNCSSLFNSIILFNSRRWQMRCVSVLAWRKISVNHHWGNIIRVSCWQVDEGRV